MIAPHVSSSCLHFYVFRASKVENRHRFFSPVQIHRMNGMINERTQCIAQKFILQTRKTVCFKRFSIFQHEQHTQQTQLNWMNSASNGIRTYGIIPQTKVFRIRMLFNVWSALCVWKSCSSPKYITTERYYFSTTLMLSTFRWKCIRNQARWNKRISWNLQAVETWTVTTDSQMFCGESDATCAPVYE